MKPDYTPIGVGLAFAVFFAALATVIILTTLLVHTATIAKEKAYTEAGLQQCQKAGGQYYLWQRDCTAY